jgi:hypothetical protein
MATPSPIWVAEAVAQSVGYLVDEMMLAVVLRNALITQSGFDRFAILAAEKMKAAGKDTAVADQLVTQARHWAPEAKKHVEENFHTVHVHTLINLWGVTFYAFEQTISACILNDRACSRAALALVDDRRDRERQLSEVDTTTIAYRLAQGCTKKTGADVAYPDLLKRFDIDFARAAARDFSGLEEVRLVRNCFVHRNGQIDRYAAERAPGLAGLVGERPKLDEPRINLYLDAMLNFNRSLMEAATKSRHYPSAQGSGQERPRRP